MLCNVIVSLLGWCCVVVCFLCCVVCVRVYGKLNFRVSGKLRSTIWSSGGELRAFLSFLFFWCLCVLAVGWCCWFVGLCVLCYCLTNSQPTQKLKTNTTHKHTHLNGYSRQLREISVLWSIWAKTGLLDLPRNLTLCAVENTHYTKWSAAEQALSSNNSTNRSCVVVFVELNNPKHTINAQPNKHTPQHYVEPQTPNGVGNRPYHPTNSASLKLCLSCCCLVSMYNILSKFQVLYVLLPY